jgi:perosamine synthetase
LSAADPSPSNAASERFLPVYQPDLSGNERTYVMQAFDSTWISSRGEFLDRFEAALASQIGTPYVSAVCNGTAALHIALHCLNLQPGDEVIVPSFTYIASVNTIVQAGGVPVFAEVREADWLLDADDVRRRITPRTRAIMAVHLYGLACDMDRLPEIAAEAGCVLIEDCAEALGTKWRGRQVGTFGRVSAWSFFGNKTVTTGEGGLVATTDPALHRRMAIVKGQGMDPDRRYWHVELGFNYRMTNIAAAIGLGQVERLDDILLCKRAIAARYRRLLAGSGVTFQAASNAVESSEWLVSLLLPRGVDRAYVMQRLARNGIETRPVFYCAHHMPPHYRPDLRLPISEDIAARGISLPSYPVLSEADINRVCTSLMEALGPRKWLSD